MKRHVTSANDVAKKAGVSQATVSRVFSSSSYVSKETRKKVLNVAKQLNYQPNALARGLITQKTNIIGIAMKDIKNPFYQEILEITTKKLRDIGYTVMFIYTNNDTIQEEELRFFLEFNVAGLIVTDALLSSDIVDKLTNYQIPVVLINRYDKSLTCHTVQCDNVNAAKSIATYIYNTGAKDIVYISGKQNTSTNQDREKGFINTLKNKDIKLTILNGDYTYEKAFSKTSHLIKKGHLPDAIFGANDITSLGALNALKMHNLSIPKDVIIVGFDNIAMASWPDNLLSTWAQPKEKMVDAAINILLSKEKQKKRQNITIPGHFIHRSTTIKSSRTIQNR